MNILITGVSGFVGQALAIESIRRGFHVKGATRYSGQIQSGVELHKIDAINGETDWMSALKDVSVVIHLAARVHVMRDAAIDPLIKFREVNTAGTERLARAAAASGVRRLIYVSTIKVNGELTACSTTFSEADAPSPKDAYGVSKCEAEEILHQVAKETGLEVVVIRPPLIYGPGVKGNFRQMLKFLASGIPLPLASVHNLRSLIYLDNFVDALIVCATHPLAAGETYLISDGEDISTPDLLCQLSASMGNSARLVPCPIALVKLAGRLAGKEEQIERLLGSLQIDSSKIRQQLNWTPPFSLQQGLNVTAVWYRDNLQR